MAMTSEAMTRLTFRRFRDGDSAHRPWQEEIFDADHSYKCPTYQLSTPPCQASCPSGEDIRGYLNIVRGIEKPPAGVSWQEYAFRRLAEANPFPAVMGRVCPAPCEGGCNRNHVDDRVGINSVEQFLGDYAIRNHLKFPKPEKSTGKKVAIIGGGPAGLSCAYQLALKGHACTIFDEHDKLGGMMRYGIPEFRVPRAVLEAEIQRILDLGVEARTGMRIGRDLSLEQLEREFDALFLGLGAQAGRPLPASGAEAPNCVTAVAFLKAFNEGRLKHAASRVVVVGGGDTSIDVATVARRLGCLPGAGEDQAPERAISGAIAHRAVEVSAKRPAQVILTTLFPLAKMEAGQHEVEQALAEGVEIRTQVAPVAVVLGPDGRARALKVARCEAAFKNSKLEIKIQEGSEEEIEADLIVSAVGQAVDFAGLEALNGGKGWIVADKGYQVLGRKGFFAGGDALRPHLLTTAIGHGWVAAENIDRYLQGVEWEKRPKVDVHVFDLQRKLKEKGIAIEPFREPLRGTCDSNVAIHNYENRAPRHVISHEELFLGHFGYAPRHERKTSSPGPERVLGHFAERTEGLIEEQAVAEAKRCMSCGLCFECDNCLVFCPQKAVKRVPKSQATTGRYVYTDYDRCIGCHICHDVCPTGYIQMGLGE